MSQPVVLDAKEFFKEIRDLYREADRRLQETERLMEKRSLETDKKFQETDKKIGRLTNRLGEFIEEMVRPGVVRLFRERGIEVHVVSRNVTAERDGEGMEIDLLVVNDGVLIAVECKSALSIDDVNDHIERLGKIKRLFPHYKVMKVMGAVAAMVLPDQVGRYAYKKGLFVLRQSGDNMVIVNDEKFEPAIW